MSDSDLIKLYSGRILQFAADILLTDRLPNPQATVKKRSPLCGSNVTVDLTTENGRIIAYGQDVKACALGQAAAAVVSAHIIGCTRAQVETARDQFKAMLKSEGPAPDAPFSDLEVLMPAKDFRNRHASVMLTLDAAFEAFAQAEKATCA